MGIKRDRSIENILSAATAEFAFKDTASIASIAERAGLPKANIHYYFKSKEALYKATLEASYGATDEASLWLHLNDAVKNREYKRAVSYSEKLMGLYGNVEEKGNG